MVLLYKYNVLLVIQV